MGAVLRGRRLLALFALLAFGLTSQGLGGLELAAHLSGLVDLRHERHTHLEPAGQSGHSDVCQLGVLAQPGRLPAETWRLLRDAPVSPRLTLVSLLPPKPFEPFAEALPRAPPA